MGIFDIMLHVRRLMMFGLAVLIGFLFQYMAIPIPFLLGGIVSSMFWKVIGAQVYWPRQWRELGLCVAGYGIGESYRRTGILAAPVARTGPLRSRLRHWPKLYGRNHARAFNAVAWCA